MRRFVVSYGEGEDDFPILMQSPLLPESIMKP